MPPLPVCSGAEVIRALEKIGYAVVRTGGSHVRLNCPARPPVTVPVHRELDPGTLRNVLREAQVDPEEFASCCELHERSTISA